MFDIRLESRYGENMREYDITLARTIKADMLKLAKTTAHMYSHILHNFNRECPNISRAARNIVRMHSFIIDAVDELDSLHDCYLAQFTDFDDDGEIIDTLPDFDFSEQSLLDSQACELWFAAKDLLICAVNQFSKFTGINADIPALQNEDYLQKFINYFIAPVAIIHDSHIQSLATV